MRKILYLVPMALMALSSCLGTSTTPAPSSVNTPTGTFTGQFRRVHKNPATNKVDTLKANLTLTLSTATGYAVTGDTTSLHAGSNGIWTINDTYITFVDNTLQRTGTPVKIHLNGSYPYGYDGSKLQFLTTFADTLAYQYDLVKK